MAAGLSEIRNRELKEQARWEEMPTANYPASNPVPLPDLQSALDALILESAPPPPGPDEFTIQMVAERAKVERHKATKMIMEWVEAGRVELVGKRRGKRGHLVDAWRVRV